MKNKKLKIVFGSVIAFIVVYAAAVLIYLGARYGARAVMSNFIGVGCICAAFCAVTLLISAMSANVRKSKIKTKEPEDAAELISEREGNSDRLIHIVIFSVCMIIAAVLIAWAVTGFGGFGLADLASGAYRKIQATVVRAVRDGGMERLVYEYTVNGTVLQSLSSAEFGGIILESGRQVNVYYAVENPQIAANLSVPVILLSGALLFAVGGVGIMISGASKKRILSAGGMGLYAVSGSEKRSNITGIMVFTLFAVFGVGFYVAGSLASGLHFFELALSGAAYYGVTIFMIAGVLLDITAAAGYIGNKIRSKKAER